MIVDNQFELWDCVYLKTDCDQKQRIVTGIIIEESGIQYRVAEGSNTSWHYAKEITTEKNVIINTSS